MAQAPTKSPERLPDEGSNGSVRILNHGTGSRKTSTSKSWKPSSYVTYNLEELYALSISEIHVADGPVPLERKMSSEASKKKIAPQQH